MVWVQVGSMSLLSRRSKGYWGRVVGFLNALFTLQEMNWESFNLAHVTLLNWVGNATPHSSEGMSKVEGYARWGGQSIVWLSAIERAVHLMSLEPERNWIVNNRVDYHVWNEMNDRLYRSKPEGIKGHTIGKRRVVESFILAS